jgi:hypothetical protein
MGNAYKIYYGGLTPHLEIESEIEDKEKGVYQVDITVENSGFLPTALQHARQIGIAKPVVLTVDTDDNLEILLGEEKLDVGHIDGNSKSEEVTYIVRKKNASAGAVLNVTVSSPRAGKAKKAVNIK